MAKAPKAISESAARKRLKLLFEVGDRTDPLWVYDVGQLTTVVFSLSGPGPDRTQRMTALARHIAPGEALTNTLSVLRSARKLVLAYDNKTQVKELARRTDKNGRPLGWQRLKIVLGEPDEKTRTRIIDQALAESWTLRRLKFELQRRHGKRSSGGRPLAVPNYAPMLIDKLMKPCEKLKRWDDELGLGKGAQLAPVAKTLTSAVRRQFARALQQVDLLHAALQEQQDELKPKPKKQA